MPGVKTTLPAYFFLALRAALSYLERAFLERLVKEDLAGRHMPEDRFGSLSGIGIDSIYPDQIITRVGKIFFRLELAEFFPHFLVAFFRLRGFCRVAAVHPRLYRILVFGHYVTKSIGFEIQGDAKIISRRKLQLVKIFAVGLYQTAEVQLYLAGLGVIEPPARRQNAAEDPVFS